MQAHIQKSIRDNEEKSSKYRDFINTEEYSGLFEQQIIWDINELRVWRREIQWLNSIVVSVKKLFKNSVSDK